MESREQRRQVINSAVEQFLDHLEEDFDANTRFGECSLGSVVIVGELYLHVESKPHVIPTYFSSNENGIWIRGMFELLTDYKRISFEDVDDDEE